MNIGKRSFNFSRARSGLVILLFSVFGFVHLAHSASFTVQGSRNRVYNHAGAVNFQIGTSGSQTLTLSLVGNYHFTLYTKRFVLPDSLGDTIAYVNGRFAGQIDDTVHADVVISNGTQVDTVHLTGYDTSYTNEPGDFTRDPDSRYFDIVNHGDTTNKLFDFINRHSDSISITARLVGDSSWSLWLDSRPTGQNPLTFSVGYYRSLTVHYSRLQTPDTAVLYLSCTSPTAQYDTIYFYGSDTGAPRLTPNIAVSETDMFDVRPGDTVCRTVQITNRGGAGAWLTSITDSTSIPDFTLTGLPTLPYRIEANASINISLCYAPENYAESSYGRIQVSYLDSNNQTGTAQGVVWGHSLPCIEFASDTIYLNDVLMGGFVDAPFTLTNHGSSSTIGETINYGLDSDEFTLLNNPFPATVASGASLTETVRFEPKSRGYHEIIYDMTSGSGCAGRLTLIAIVTDSTADSLSIYPNETEVLSLTGTDSVVHRTFYFRNNAAQNTRVTDMHFANGSHFSITGVSPHALPDTLAPMGVLSADLEFDADSAGYYSDSLVLTTAFGAVAQTYIISGIRRPVTADVRASQEIVPLSVMINPNPSAGEMTTIATSGLDRIQIEIFDILGNKLADYAGLSTVNWNPQSMANGSYIVRVSGVDATGHAVTTSKHLILNR